MRNDSRKTAPAEAGLQFGPDTIEEAMRTRVRAVLEQVIDEELTAALGAAPSTRVGAARVGYRHGRRPRTVTTSLGPTTVQVPRARLQADDRRREWQSAILPRYQRRTARVDEAILGVYLTGTNTRRVKSALAPLLRGAPLSKDAVSRLVGRLRGDFDTWRARDLAAEQIRYLFLDGWYPKVRIGKRRVRVPILVTLGVRADGERVVLDLRMAGEESTESWGEVLRGLAARQLGTPVLAVIDGNLGLATALRAQWPAIALQRCTAHKLRNVQAKTPVALREEVTEDYQRMIYADSPRAVEHARMRFLKKWRVRCPAVGESLEEAGDTLFTYLRFPASQWKALRTTNALERINGEFRRRTKTQASLPSHDAVLLLLFGLLQTGHVKLRALIGYNDMHKVTAAA